MTSPSRGFSSTGVFTLALPISAESGQVGGSLEPILICANEQAPRPATAEGLTVIPCGKVVTTLRTLALAKPPGSSFWGTLMSIAIPVGEAARWVPGVTVTAGLKETRSQPSVMKGVPSRSALKEATEKMPGVSQLSAATLVIPGVPGHEVGLERKGTILVATEAPRLWGFPIVPPPNRSGSWLGSAGTPQRVITVPKTL